MPTLQKQKITPFLWFNEDAESAVNFYISLFPDSRIHHVTRYTAAGQEHHRRPPGTAMTVAFQLAGQHFTALNGGPLYTFTEAVSFSVACDTQDEIDHYWNNLSQGGDPESQRCGWLKDRWGLSWQIIPASLPQLFSNPATSQKVMTSLLQMQKLILKDLEAAARP